MSQTAHPVSLDEMEIRQLARVIRGIFPHDDFGDGPYLRSAQAISGSLGAGIHRLLVIREGLRSVRELAGGDLEAIDVDATTALLRHVQRTDFFRLVLLSSIVTLYSDAEVHEILGYEGPSYDKGGYLHRGFNDLAWLPEPRIEEYTGEPLLEYAPPVPGLEVDFGKITEGAGR